MTKEETLADITARAQIIAKRIQKLARPNRKPTLTREMQRACMIVRFAVQHAVLQAEWLMVASQPKSKG
jgi:hypothetical protein